MASSNKKLIYSYIQSNIQMRFIIGMIFGLVILGVGLYQFYSAYSFNQNVPANQSPKSYATAFILSVIGIFIIGFAFFSRSVTKKIVKNVVY
jgi:hypothetical protein